MYNNSMWSKYCRKQEMTKNTGIINGNYNYLHSIVD